MVEMELYKVFNNTFKNKNLIDLKHQLLLKQMYILILESSIKIVNINDKKVGLEILLSFLHYP